MWHLLSKGGMLSYKCLCGKVSHVQYSSWHTLADACEQYIAMPEEYFKCYIYSSYVTAFFCWVFHMALNSLNTILKKPWRLLEITRYLYCASRNHHSNVLDWQCTCTCSSFGVKLISNNLMHKTSPDLLHRFSKYFTALYWDWSNTSLRNLVWCSLF